ncbi:MAG TPA: TIR domain-containing protein [Methanotrichaceae archaeon]|nr:TIR domain-containing protein [Methanotrichaceae archaeon]HQI91625.1 TIR domain-containing protein [Methanotrichaceae archaeon]HQJ28881.1 TIR domain-containing protein [Methanotrichaceae archaeon]
MIGKIYISHAKADQHLAQSLAAALGRLGLESQWASFRQPAELGWAERVMYGIRSSDLLVALITEEGSLSRTVHQEIGFARGIDHLIVPLIEEGSELPFLIDHLTPIPFSPQRFPDAVGSLIRAIRAFTRLEWLRVSCPHCGEEMTQYLPTQDSVDRAWAGRTGLETMCSYCQKGITIDPRDFSPCR